MVKRVPAITWDVVSTWKSWDIHYQPINWCCSPDFQTINRKGWSSSNRIFFPGAMHVNFRKATKAVTYQKGMNLAKLSYFINLPTATSRTRRDSNFAKLDFFAEIKGSHFPSKKSYAQVVWGRYHLTRNEAFPGLCPPRVPRQLSPPGNGCQETPEVKPRLGLKLLDASMYLDVPLEVSKWLVSGLIPLVYSIYR